MMPKNLRLKGFKKAGDEVDKACRGQSSVQTFFFPVKNLHRPMYDCDYFWGNLRDLTSQQCAEDSSGTANRYCG